MSDNSNSDAQNNLGVMKDDDEISLLDVLQVIVDNLRLLVLGPLVCGLVAFGICISITPIFTAKTQFLPPQQQQSAAASMLATLGALGGLTGTAAGIKSPADQYIAFMRSVSLQDVLIERFKLLEKYEVKLKSDARLALKGSVRITSGKDSLISVEVDDEDPRFAATLANAHVEELSKLLGRLAVTEAQQRRLFFQKQLQITKENLTNADLALKSSGINSSVLKSSPSSAIEAVARLKAGISVQEVKLGSMRNYLTESAPEFKQALNELDSLRRQLSKAEMEEPAKLGASDYVTRYREFKYQETMFELFTKQFELAKVDESREGAIIQVLDVADTPERKAKPKIVMTVLITILVSGFAILLFVFVRSALTKVSRDEATNRRFAALKGSFKRAVGIS